MSTVLIASTKYDGSLHYEFEAELLGRSEDGVRCLVHAGTPWVGYRGEGKIQRAMTALFFLDRWYNVYHYHELGRRQIAWYANLGTPARLDGRVLRWVDLDLDVLHIPGGLRVDDEDEFADHRVRFGYPDEVVANVLSARDEVLRLGAAGGFPFDRSVHVPGARTAAELQRPFQASEEDRG